MDKVRSRVPPTAVAVHRKLQEINKLHGLEQLTIPHHLRFDDRENSSGGLKLREQGGRYSKSTSAWAHSLLTSSVW